jgi:hypothetical protein
MRDLRPNPDGGMTPECAWLADGGISRAAPIPAQRFGLLARTFVHMIRVDPGFNAARALQYPEPR